MEGLEKPQIICHIEKSVEYSLFDAKWIPSSAKFVTLGSKPRGAGIIQIYEITNGELKVIKDIERPTPIKCGTFKASDHRNRHFATGDFKKICKIRSSLENKYLNGSSSTKESDVPGINKLNSTLPPSSDIVQQKIVGLKENSGDVIVNDVDLREVTSFSFPKEDNALSISVDGQKENFIMNTVTTKMSIETQTDFTDYIAYKDETCQTYINQRSISSQTS